MKSKHYLFTFLCFVSTLCVGQLFTKIIPQEAVGVNYSHNSWVDFDNDGDLDFLLTGASSTNDLRTILYENTRNDVFRQALSPFNLLPQYSESEIALINANGDNRIDVLLMGRRIAEPTTSRISLLENLETGFKDTGTIPGFGRGDGYGTISVGDVNNDGANDVFLSGIAEFGGGSPNLSAFLFINENGTYVKSTTSTFMPLYIAASRLADLDNDRDLDLIVSGNDGTFPYQNTIIYLNNGEGDFVPTSSTLQKLQNTSIDLADLDGDHDLDVLLTGLDPGLQHTTSLYLNTNGSFTALDLPADMDRTASGSAKWGDYDNDGDLDIVITGHVGPTPMKLGLFQNNGAGQFIEIADTAFEPLGLGGAPWGDYDDDGDLDIVVTGAVTNQPDLVPVLYILKSGVGNKNEKPDAPGNFRVTPTSANSCLLDWDEAHDQLTPSPALTYNISVRNTATGEYLQHPFSDDVSGKRRVSEPGNVWLNRGWKLKSLKSGTWSLKVQAIDGAFAGSSWSETKKFYSGTPSAPTNLSLVHTNGNNILSWTDNSINEEFFVIERSTNGGNYVRIDSAHSNIITHSQPNENFDRYEYRVNSVNPNQRSAYSNSVKTTVGTPSTLTVSFLDGNVDLHWTDNSYNEQFFVIERRVDISNFVKVGQAGSNTSSYSDQQVPEGPYDYRVYAKNPNDSSAYSNIASVLVTGVELTSPTGNNIYPNPASELVRFTVINAKHTTAPTFFLDARGVVQQSPQLYFDDNGEAQADVSALPAGLYLVKVRTGTDGIVTLRFLKL